MSARTGGGLFTREATPVGTWLKIASGEPAEIMAFAGFDFVVVDLEHAPLDLETAYRLINTAAALGMTPIVRVPDKTPSTIQKILDAGAMGILVPHVDTVEEAAAVGRACRFPPHGVRGAGGTSRAGAWGLKPNAEYLATGNDDVLCIPQLESVEAIKAAPEMLALDTVDAVFVGAADLSMSHGFDTRVAGRARPDRLGDRGRARRREALRARVRRGAGEGRAGGAGRLRLRPAQQRHDDAGRSRPRPGPGVPGRDRMTLSLPRTALSIAELDDLDHHGVVRFVRALEEYGHRMVWIPEVAGREAFTTAALVLASTSRLIVGNGVARALERVPKSAGSAARDLAAGLPRALCAGARGQRSGP